MKVMLLGDTHFGARGDNPIVLDHFINFYKEQFFVEVEKQKPDLVLQLGDLLDRRKFANFSTLSVVRNEFLGPLTSDLKVPLWVLVGNHDTYYRNTLKVNGIEQSFGDFLKSGKMRLFDSPTETDIGLIIPWICEENQEHVKSSINSSSSDFCFGHFELTGYDMYRGMPCEHGDDPKFLSRFRQVYSGHFHTHSRKSNICYIGTPYDIIWSDSSDQKWFMMLDTETGQESWFQNPDKLHHKVMIDSSKMGSLKEVIDLKFNHLSGKFVKLIVLNSDRPDVIEVVSKAIRSVGPATFTIIDSTPVENVLGDENDGSSISHKDPLTALNDEIDRVHTAERAKRLKVISTELYTQALQGVFE